ncbi:MAG: hypothetical protein WA726_01230, partial [Acidimicrobiia bacterium]
LQASWAFVVASRLRAGVLPLRTARVRFRNPLPPATPVSISIDETDDTVELALSDARLEYLSARIMLGDR